MRTPFIQLFKTPRCQYVFDVNMNEILPISAESFLFLNKCISGEADVTASEIKEIQELCQSGYLKTESVVQKIQHPYTPYLKYFLDRKLSKITLQVTQGCNLRCKYCIYSEDVNKQQRTHSNRRMNWDIAKASIDFLYKHSVDSDKVNVGFYGGEPLLEISLIEQSVAYAKKIFDGKEVSFSITSNGTLLDDNIINFLVRENINLLISLDGPKEIHDRSRIFADGSGSFDTVMQKIKRIKTIAPDYAKKLSFSMVMDPRNDFDCINEITFSMDDMNEHSVVASIVDTDYDDKNLSFSEEYLWKSAYQNFLAILAMYNRYPAEKVSVISKNIIGTLHKNLKLSLASGILQSSDVPSGPCIPGQLRLFVDTSGRLFPCERVSENSKAMSIGSLETGFLIHKAERLLNVGSITEDACRKCWCIRHCSLCCKKADCGEEMLSASVRLSNCNAVQNSAYAKLRQLIMLREIPLYYRSQIRPYIQQ